MSDLARLLRDSVSQAAEQYLDARKLDGRRITLIKEAADALESLEAENAKLRAVAEAAKGLMRWDTGDAMNERDRADRALRKALAALESKGTP